MMTTKSEEVKKEEYIIAEVPFRSAFSGHRLSTSASTIAQMLSLYWGDLSVSEDDLWKAFPYSSFESGKLDSSIDSTKSFFESRGFLGEIVNVRTVDDVRDYIKADIPVLVQQRFDLETPAYVRTQRLIIGFSDDTEEVIVHDNNFGNNYKISYAAFELLSGNFSRNGLVLTPSATLVSAGLSPVREPYPDRLAMMDDPDLVAVQRAWVHIDALTYKVKETTDGISRREIYEQIVLLWEGVVFGPGFAKLHPAGRYAAAFQLGRLYTNELGEHSRAIDVFDGVAVPLTEHADFREPFGEWERPDPTIYDDPWWKTGALVGLGVAHIRLGQAENAREAFERVVSIDPANQDAQMFFAGDFSFADVNDNGSMPR